MERYYTLPTRCVMINTNLCIFQYKLLHNILYINEITNMEKRYPHFALFAWIEDPHLFYSCTKTNFLWILLHYLFQDVQIIPLITPHSTIFGFTDDKVS